MTNCYEIHIRYNKHFQQLYFLQLKLAFSHPKIEFLHEPVQNENLNFLNKTKTQNLYENLTDSETSIQ